MTVHGGMGIMMIATTGMCYETVDQYIPMHNVGGGGVYVCVCTCVL